MISKATPLKYVESIADQCEKCGHCCSYGSGYFLAEDIDRVARMIGMKKDLFIKEFLEEHEAYNKKIHRAKLKKQPFGPCMFLEKSECAIHDFKPLHCRLSKGCGEYGEQISIWFVLNYVLDKNDPEAIRQWAQYLSTHPTIPGGELHELVTDKERLSKIMNYEIFR